MVFTTILDALLADLTHELPPALRLQRLVRAHFRCDAVCLLRLDGDSLRPVAAEGLVREALGRRFAVAQHPRLAAILGERTPVCFEPDDPRPDPYDGLVDTPGGGRFRCTTAWARAWRWKAGPWGALTLDALAPGTFGASARAQLLRGTLLEQRFHGARTAAPHARASRACRTTRSSATAP